MTYRRGQILCGLSSLELLPAATQTIRHQINLMIVFIVLRKSRNGQRSFLNGT